MNEATLTTQPLHVLGISTSYPVRQSSKSGIFVHRLYVELALNNHISVICPGDSLGSYECMLNNVVIHPVNYASMRLRSLDRAGGIIPSLRAAPLKLFLLPGLLLCLTVSLLKNIRGADLIHANWAISGVLAGFIGKLSGKPVVTTFRGDDIARARFSRIDRLLLGLAVRWSQKIICVSKPMAQDLINLFPVREMDIHACLNGVDDAFFEVMHTAEIKPQLRIVSVGSLIARKAFDVLIRSIALCEAKSKIELHIVGEGPCRSELMLLATELGISERVHFLGELDQRAIRVLFSDIDLFVLSSRSEGRPNAVIEAVAAGLPVISTNLDGVQDLVKPNCNGWLFQVDDVNGLADCLDAAYEHKNQLPGMGEAGRKNIAPNAGWAGTARCYNTVFRSALSAARN